MSILENDKTMTVLRKALDAASVRHKAISHNIANVNTPNFKADKVLFEEELNRVLRQDTGNGEGFSGITRTHDAHFGGASSLQDVQPVVVKDETSSMRVNGNNVDIDLQAADLAANQLMYEAILRRINGKISSLKAVISGGR